MFNPLTQESEQLDLSPITNALDSVRRAVIANTGQESIEVSNFDEVRLAIKKEIAVLVDKLKPLMLDMCKAMPEMPSEMRVSNFPKMEVMPETMTVSNLSELGDLLTRLIQSVESINVSPIVNVPAPIVNIPEQMAPVVNIPPMPMQMPLDLSPILQRLDPLKLLSRDPNKPITVRMSDGRSFIDAIANVLKDNGEKMATMVSTSYGLSKDEMSSLNNQWEDPTTPYKIADKDADASPNYYGFTDAHGDWYIMKETISAGADTYRYAKGSTGYIAAWTGRASLTFDYFDVVF